MLNFILTSFASWLERRLRRSKKSTGAVLGQDTVEINPAAVRGAFGTGENTGGG